MTTTDLAIPFLTTIVLVESNEVGLLEDLLLCLDGQSNQDFNVILVLRDMVNSEAEQIEHIVQRFKVLLANKTSLLPASGGRAALVSIQHYRRSQDDTWLWLTRTRCFLLDGSKTSRELSKIGPSTVLRSSGLEQGSSRTTWPGGEQGHEATEGPERRWPLAFSAVDALLASETPLQTCAIPTACFTEHGLAFDEQIVTGADWELFLRAALLCGVTDTDGEVTAIVRRWSSPRSVFEKSARSQARKAVLDSLDRAPLSLPVGSASRIQQLGDREDDFLAKVHAIERERDWFAKERNEAIKRLEQIESMLAQVQQSATVPSSQQASTISGDDLSIELARVQGELAALLQSTSWKLTAPLRKVIGTLRSRKSQD